MIMGAFLWRFDVNKSGLAVKVFVTTLFFMVFIAALIFVPAGTINYWQGWVYCGVLFTPMVASGFYLLALDPEFLERRMRVEEKEKPQKLIRPIGGLLYFGTFVLAGLDHRFGWSQVPVAVVVAGDALLLMSFLFITYVFNINRFAGSTIRVEEGQQVIDTGPYAVVRHPMYTGALLMFIDMALALGSWWSLLMVIPLAVILGLRACGEEATLRNELPGYDDYTRRVRWRLIPGIW
jgi:protein-S-isoprenylcysteine O-methyltransferase Ste14